MNKKQPIGQRIFKFSADIMGFYGIPFLAAIIACSQVLANGYPHGSDWLLEIVRVAEYRDAILSGQFIPFWGNNLYYGLGSPVFVFYAPLYSALSSLGMFLGLPLFTSLTLVLVLMSIASAIGMAHLIKDLGGAKSYASSRIAAAIYVMSPYLLANMMLRNASAEYVALCIAPFPLWGLVRIYYEKSHGLLIFICGFSLVILAHNLSALLMASAVLITSILVYIFSHSTIFIVKSAFGFLSSIGLTAWFWFPALHMKSEVHINELLKGKFDFNNNFINSEFLLGYEKIYSLGFIAPVILIISAIYLLKKNKHFYFVIMYLLLLAMFFLFLLFPTSAYFWENLPFMSLFQFPYRMLGPFSLVVAIISGLLSMKYIQNNYYLEAMVLVLVCINTLPTLTKYESLPENIIKHKNEVFSERSIKDNGLPVTASDEYLPIHANTKYMGGHLVRKIAYAPESSELSNVVQDGANIKFNINIESASLIEISRLYFPVWKVSINGKIAPLTASETGLIMINLNPGMNSVELSLLQPLSRKVGFFIGVLSFLIIFVIWRKHLSRTSINNAFH